MILEAAFCFSLGAASVFALLLACAKRFNVSYTRHDDELSVTCRGSCANSTNQPTLSVQNASARSAWESSERGHYEDTRELVSPDLQRALNSQVLARVIAPIVAAAVVNELQKITRLWESAANGYEATERCPTYPANCDVARRIGVDPCYVIAARTTRVQAPCPDSGGMVCAMCRGQEKVIANCAG